MLTRRQNRPTPSPAPEGDELDDAKSDLTDLDIKSESDFTPEPFAKPATGKRKVAPTKSSSGSGELRKSTRADNSQAWTREPMDARRACAAAERDAGTEEGRGPRSRRPRPHGTPVHHDMDVSYSTSLQLTPETL